jgi:hypothetical protein
MFHYNVSHCPKCKSELRPMRAMLVLLDMILMIYTGHLVEPNKDMQPPRCPHRFCHNLQIGASYQLKAISDA